MTTRIAPDLVSDDLVDLTRRLGAPERDLVILAEGNTSEFVGDDTIVVKTSGSPMADASATSFVAASVSELADLLHDLDVDQSRVTAALATAEGPRASIETLIHVAVRMLAPARFVAHTHPTAVLSLLASARAAESLAEPVYTDELMVLGRPLFVPYAEPGLPLARLFAARLAEDAGANGELPSLVLLGNHGIVAISDSSAGAEAISLMAVKSARVRLGALQAGGIAGLGQTAAYFDRPDFAARRAKLAGRPAPGG